MTQRIERGEKQAQDDQERDGEDHGEPALLFLQAVVFAGPFDVIALGKMDSLRQARLNLLNRARQVASAHAELDGNVAAAVLAKNHERALAQRNVGDLSERDVAS